MTGPLRTIAFRGERLQLPLYLDHHATTPLDPRVLDAMLPYFTERFGNPHSTQHAHGRAAEAAIEQARREVAALIGALPEEIVFTSGATEANNLAIRGVAARAGERRHLVTCAIEHPSVLGACRALVDAGFEVTELSVQPNGVIDPDLLRAALRPDTALVSIQSANHEIGVLQPIAEIARVCRERGVLLHTDAAQAAGRVPLDAAVVDLMSLSAHKLYGPKGIGALYVRRGIRIAPLLAGGAQEGGLRPGTLPTPLCVGFGRACALAREEMPDEAARLGELRDRLYRGLGEAVGEIRLNGAAEPRLPNNLNVSLPGLDAEDLLAEVPELAMSTGAACASATEEPSPVLRALGLSDDEIQGSLRIGLGRTTRSVEIEFAIERLGAAARRLRTG
ncbi:MAG TPA: cysteine desulfurase family protein [Geminicoccaceae bacterium]|nr:cysteine desulfurase family protein [Geminicoccaceae bacterium]